MYIFQEMYFGLHSNIIFLNINEKTTFFFKIDFSSGIVRKSKYDTITQKKYDDKIN